jgi:hypothetical protein
MGAGSVNTSAAVVGELQACPEDKKQEATTIFHSLIVFKNYFKIFGIDK